MNKDRIIDFDDELTCTKAELDCADATTKEVDTEITETNIMLQKLSHRIQLLTGEKVEIDSEKTSNYSEIISALNKELDDIVNNQECFEKISKFPKLEIADILVSVFAGIVATVIDVVFIGTPDVVKIYKGGEQFDGSRLTQILRNVGKTKDGELSPILEWFSEKCKVPYDIPAYKNTMNPNNHRLRSLAHDPLFGLIFAVADIIMGTTTCINNSGLLTIIPSKNKAATSEKWLSVLYYLGHLISDVCTARGLPIPGFFMLEFFTTGIGDKSIAKIAEEMYINGYDLRHMLSMGTSVFVKDQIINMYLKLTEKNVFEIQDIASKEKREIDKKLKRCKIKFIADSVATTGNLVKFFAPPSCGNPTSINLIQWISFAKNSIEMGVAACRDNSFEKAIVHRGVIDEGWQELDCKKDFSTHH